MRVMLKSAYLPYDSNDGTRYLVETLWPEGVEMHGLSPYLWVHELAPSYYMKEKALGQHWGTERFRAEYRQELQEPHRRTWYDLILAEARKKGVTLLHGSHKKESQILPEDTTAYYLKEFLEAAAAVGRPAAGSNQAAEQWANEGGK